MADLKNGYNERVLGNSCVVEAVHSGFYRVVTKDGRGDLVKQVGAQRFDVGDVGRTVYYGDGRTYGLVRFDKDPAVEFDFEKAKQNYPYGWKEGWPQGEASLEERLAEAKVKSVAQETAKDAINLDDYEPTIDIVDGYNIYRKVLRDENGQPIKGIWAAQKNDGEPFPITYDQALGRVPIEDTPVKRLARQLGEILLP